LAWQTTNAAGTPIVRARAWVTRHSGEARTCAGCHRENSRNQAGNPSPTNKPEALRELLRYWKLNQ
jgi:cytochrome c553